MSNKVRFYTIAFENQEGVVLKDSVYDFLYKLNDTMNNNIEAVKKDVSGKMIRIFSISDDSKTLKQFVMPFGKLKNNVSYTEDKSSKSLTPIDYDIYDVNMMYYDEQHKVMLLTRNTAGPNYTRIENYLNMFISDKGMRIKINPIYYNDKLETIKKAYRIKSILIKFNFNKCTKEFINRRLMCDEKCTPLLSSVKGIATCSQNIDASDLQIILNAGNRKLDKQSLMAFLDELHIEDDYINDIHIHYCNGEKEKIKPARLKKMNIVLDDEISGVETIDEKILLGKPSSELESKAQEIIKRNINRFYLKTKEYFEWNIGGIILKQIRRDFMIEIILAIISLILILINKIKLIDLSNMFNFINVKWISKISEEGISTSNLITFLTITIGIYLSILCIISTSQSNVIKVLLERNKEDSLGFTVVGGIIENLIAILFILFTVDFYYKNFILLSIVLISVVSFIKFIFILFYFYKISNNETIKSIDQEIKDKSDLFASLEILKENTKPK